MGREAALSLTFGFWLSNTFGGFSQIWPSILADCSSVTTGYWTGPRRADQSNLAPGSLRVPRPNVAEKSHPCRACLATTRQSENPPLRCSNMSAARIATGLVAQGSPGVLHWRHGGCTGPQGVLYALCRRRRTQPAVSLARSLPRTLRGFGDVRGTLQDDIALVHPLSSEYNGEVPIGRAISWGGHVV